MNLVKYSCTNKIWFIINVLILKMMVCCMYIPGSPSASILSDVASIQSRLDDLPTSQWRIGGLGSEVSILKGEKIKSLCSIGSGTRKKGYRKKLILPRSCVYICILTVYLLDVSPLNSQNKIPYEKRQLHNKILL